MSPETAVLESPLQLEILDWGTLEYGEALARQRALVEERIAERAPDRLVLVEHPPVVTIGRSGGAGDLRVAEEALRRRGIPVFRVARGGMATFHGPGQLVAYPIVKVDERDLHRYIEKLLGAVSDVLRGYGLAPEVRDGTPGVWAGGAKIASVGIAVKRWVTYHGVALNVSTDPSWFDWIVPCGNSGERITSLELELGRPVALEEVKERFVEEFRRSFGYTARGRSTSADHGSRFTADGSRVTVHASRFTRHDRHPPWLVRPAPDQASVGATEGTLRRLGLATVCEGAHCPNVGECYGRGTATFLILGTRCTRACRFCAVEGGVPAPPDPGEPGRVAEAAEALGLRHVVVTSVTRDDLADEGAGHFAETIRRVRLRCPEARVEVLVPDFGGSLAALETVFEAAPDVFNHNIETVPRLYPDVRPGARYRRSLGVLECAAQWRLRVKSGLMLGLGETAEEIRGTLADLRRAGCRDLTLGQYLAPSPDHASVARYVPPEEFDEWARVARSLGFEGIASGPLVRSSYRAEEMWGRPEKVVGSRFA